jgi:glutaredoxin-related protein
MTLPTVPTDNVYTQLNGNLHSIAVELRGHKCCAAICCTSTLAASCELSVTAVTQEFDADANSHITPLHAPIVLFICVQLVSSKPVMLFMKGNPAEPRCGFSRTIVALLQEQGFEFSTFDILQVLELALHCNELILFCMLTTTRQFSVVRRELCSSTTVRSHRQRTSWHLAVDNGCLFLCLLCCCYTHVG